MSKPSSERAQQLLYRQVAQIHSTMFGEGNTEGTVSAVRRIEKSLAVHVDGGRAEARKISAITSLAITFVGMILIPLIVLFIV